MIRMSKRYGHHGQAACAEAVKNLNGPGFSWLQMRYRQRGMTLSGFSKCKQRMAPQVGLEPTILRLTARLFSPACPYFH